MGKCKAGFQKKNSVDEDGLNWQRTAVNIWKFGIVCTNWGLKLYGQKL